MPAGVDSTELITLSTGYSLAPGYPTLAELVVIAIVGVYFISVFLLRIAQVCSSTLNYALSLMTMFLCT